MSRGIRLQAERLAFGFDRGQRPLVPPRFHGVPDLARDKKRQNWHYRPERALE